MLLPGSIERSDGPFGLIEGGSVRRHINWNNQRPDLKEDLAYATFQPEKQGKNLRQTLSREFDHFMGG